MKILIATPVAKTVEERYCQSMFDLCKYETEKGNDVDLQLERGPRIHHNRNQFVRQFLEGDYEYLLQVDMDVAFPPTTLEKLLSHGMPIVFGLYKLPQPHGNVSSFVRLTEDNRYRPVGSSGDGLLEIDAGGTGVCLTHRKVFEAIDDTGAFPWFDLDVVGNEFLSEDYTFCRRVKEAGFKIYGDCNVETLHVKDFYITNRR